MKANTGGRLMLVVIVAASMSTLGFILGAIGLFGSLLGATVDSPEALRKWGIEIAPGTALTLVNWGIAAVGVVAIWVFAFCSMYHFRVLPGQESSPRVGYRHTRIAVGSLGAIVILAGIGAVCGVEWLSASIPCFAILVGAMALILALLPGSAWFWIRDALVAELGSGDVLYEVAFSQRLEPPLWGLAEGVEPDFVTVDEGGVRASGAIQIVPKGRYALDHMLPWPSSDVRSVELECIRGDGFLFFLKCRLRAADGHRINRWLAFRTGNDAPFKHQTRGGTEWVVSIPSSPDTEWERLRIDFDERWQQTFEQDGGAFIALLGFRLRGAMSLARVTVRK